MNPGLKFTNDQSIAYGRSTLLRISIEDIESGLQALVEEVQRFDIKSLAIPPLGCGNGGLNWKQVKPIITESFAGLPDIKVVIFEPGGAPVADRIKIATKKPNMTLARALFIRLLEIYEIPGYRLTKIEIQKLAYFLQAAEDCEKAIALCQQWNDRKRKLFKPSHLQKAWERLKQQNWLSNSSAIDA